MCRLVLAALVLFVVAGTSSGVRWVKLTAGDPLPVGSVYFPQNNMIVGRARHFNNIVPAEVRKNSTARITVCDKKITKYNFEVLTSQTPCSWQRLQRNDNLPENLVLVGHENAHKARFVGARLVYNSNPDIHIFSLDPNEITNVISNSISVLVCKTTRLWLDASANAIPKNAVAAGKLTEKHDGFIARLLKSCQIYPGQVIPEKSIATARVGNETIVALYSQVLVGDANEFSWVSVTDEEFPDNAVVGSTDKYNLYYVAKHLPTNTITYTTNLFRDDIRDYLILVENETNTNPESPTNKPAMKLNWVL